MKFRSQALLAVAVTAAAASVGSAQVSMTPLATFGTAGWLAPGSSPFLTTGNTERGLAFNPTTGHLLLVSRAGGNNIRILDATTGADLGALNTTGLPTAGT